MNLKCDNCDYVCTDGNANLVKDLLQRVESGGIMPGGECPKCTALMYPTKEPTVKQCYKAGECPDCQLEVYDAVAPIDKASIEQGFIDNFGNFLTREEAWLVAKAAGQVIKVCGGNGSGKLFSENLY